MSTDGTPPPSIAPKRPVPAGASARAAEVPTRPATGPVSGSGAGAAGSGGATGNGTSAGPTVGPLPTSARTTTTPTVGGEPESSSAQDAETTTTPSFTGRLKQAAQGAVEAARTVLPTKDEDEMTAAPTTSTPRTAPQRTSTASTTAGRSTGTSSVSAASAGPRRVRLAVARIDPWSVMKLSFLLSVAAGIMLVVAAAVVWYTLDGLHVFTSVNDVIATLAGSETFFDLLEYVAFKRIISLATMIAVVDIVILTALSTIGAFLYNIVAALVGGIHLTLTDD